MSIDYIMTRSQDLILMEVLILKCLQNLNPFINIKYLYSYLIYLTYVKCVYNIVFCYNISLKHIYI